MALDDYYWDGREYKKKDKTLSDLLLGLNALYKIPPPLSYPPPFGTLLASRVLSKGPTKIWERFNLFLSRLELSTLQKQDAITKSANVNKVLHNSYYTVLSSASSHIVVGSHMKGTAIAPPSDIDILFILPVSNFKRFDSYVGNGQSALLQEIRNKLLASFPNTEMKADGQAILAPFASYNVEIVPSFIGNDGAYITPDSNDGGKWKLTCPSAEKLLLNKSNVRSLGNTIKLIKMVKAWKNYCLVDIKSLVIELRSIYFLEKWLYFNKGSVYYDWMIRDFFEELLKYVNGNCVIPGLEEKVLYGDAWKSKTEMALARARKACDYESINKTDLAVEEWKKIFGDRFPT